jgi:hypothetical protein
MLAMSWCENENNGIFAAYQNAMEINMKIWKLTSIAAISLALSGCYSFSVTHVDSLFGSSSDNTQSLKVSTQPSGGDCSVTSTKQDGTKTVSSIYSNSRAASVDIYKGPNPVSITCSKNGYAPTTQVLYPNTDGSFVSSVTVTLQPIASSS